MSIMEFLNLTDTRTPCDVCEMPIEEGRDACLGECEKELAVTAPMRADESAEGDSTFLGLILRDDQRL